MTIRRSVSGVLDGAEVEAFVLTNANGLRARVIGLGATLVEMLVPDRDGVLADVVLGYDSVADYAASTTYFGATAGRYANRIRAGRFTLDGTQHQLSLNEGGNHLHGGLRGFDRKLFRGEVDEAGDAVIFRLVSPDGDEGYPGTLDVEVRYRLGDDDILRIGMRATTDAPTIVNLVNHAYWNLAGAASGTVLDQVLRIDGDFYTPCDAALLPTGEVRRVEGSGFDFRRPKPIGRDIGGVNAGAGYDHNWILRGFDGSMRVVAEAHDPASGRTLVLSGNEAGVQVYAGGYLGPEIVGKGGLPCRRFGGFTLETQRFPDSPNLTHFPSPVLRPGEVYDHRMAFRFFVTGNLPD